MLTALSIYISRLTETLNNTKAEARAGLEATFYSKASKTIFFFFETPVNNTLTPLWIKTNLNLAKAVPKTYLNDTLGLYPMISNVSS